MGWILGYTGGIDSYFILFDLTMGRRARTNVSAATANVATSKVTQGSAAAKPKPKPRASRKPQVKAAPLASLQETRNVEVKETTAVKNTDNAYDGHLDRGMRFLATLIEERRARGEDICSEGISTDEFEKAFDKPPNKYSAMAIEMFIVQKCFVQKLGKDTGYGIHGAFARYWDTM
jgi:hypothetical protein